MTSIAFIILIAISGLLLNHADALGLSTSNAAGPLIARMYGVKAPPIDVAFEAGNVVFAHAGTGLYADDHELAANADELLGAVVVDKEIVLATAQSLYICTKDGRLIERLAHDLPAQLDRVGTDSGRLILAADSRYFEFNLRTTRLNEIDAAAADNIDWSEPVILNEAQATAIGKAAFGRSLNWERVIGDLHSGRLLPHVGRYIADLAALCLLYLCFSGLLLWFRRR